MDFVTLDGTFVIEVDGATHSSPIEAAHDAERTRLLDAIGFRVLRVTNTDVNENMDGVLTMIDRELKQRPK